MTDNLRIFLESYISGTNPGELSMIGRKPKGYWKDNLPNEAQTIMKTEGVETLPGERALREMGYVNFVAAVKYHYGSLVTFREEIGQKKLRVHNGKPSDREYVISEVNRVMDENELTKIPSQQQLNRLGYSNLANAISKHHGGFRKFRESLGEKQLEVEKDVWREISFVLDQAKKIMDENGWERLPTSNELRGNGYSGFVSAITRYHKLNNVRELLGHETIRKSRGLWSQIGYTLEYAANIADENDLEDLPGNKRLVSLGHGDLANAIQRWHGGLKVFRKHLREYRNQQSEDESLQGLLEIYAGGTE